MSEDDRLGVVDVTGQEVLPAGEFSAWLHATRAALKKRGDAQVPCGECNACCRSSYFIHIEPDETRTLASIPEQLLFAAPGRPEGHVLLGYDEHGCCPMLVDGRCSIYQHRPRTCRSYDCRVFAATGIGAGGDDKAPVNEQIPRWRFTYPTDDDSLEYAALQAAARFLAGHAEHFAERVSHRPTGLALLAVEVYGVFLEHLQGGGAAPPDAETIEAVLNARS